MYLKIFKFRDILKSWTNKIKLRSYLSLVAHNIYNNTKVWPTGPATFPFCGPVLFDGIERCYTRLMKNGIPKIHSRPIIIECRKFFLHTQPITLRRCCHHRCAFLRYTHFLFRSLCPPTRTLVREKFTISLQKRAWEWKRVYCLHK